MSEEVSFPDVLRGIGIDAKALRLSRPRTSPGAESSDSDAVAASVEDERRRGYEEGLRTGAAEGQEAGYREGVRRGEQETAARRDAAIAQAVEAITIDLRARRQQLEALAQSMEAAAHEASAIGQDELAAFCYAAVCRVFGSAVWNREVLQPHLSHLLATARSMDEIIALRLHPEDAESVRSGALTLPAGIRCVSDPEIQLGGCIATGARGGLDMRLETMLEALKNAVRQARADWGAGEAS